MLTVTREITILNRSKFDRIKERIEIKNPKLLRKVMGTIIVVLALFAGFVGWVYFSTFQPDKTQPAHVSSQSGAPLISDAEKIKLLDWNVQFMAGKDYYFYYEGGPDIRPSPDDIARTGEEVARIIKEEDPDIILLQEVDDGAKRTDHEDQLENLLTRLPDEYRSHSSAFYWKADFSPHPKILGSVGMKLSIISKYKIGSATRYQLPLKPDNWFVRQFDLKRAVLEVRFPRDEADDLVVLNTHLTAFAFGSDVRTRQVDKIHTLLKEKSSAGYPWVLGGDFNLTPPGKAGRCARSGGSDCVDETNVIEPLFDNYRAVPGLEEVNGPNPEAWYTHFPNNPDIDSPTKTIDYVFLSDELSLNEYYVRQEGTLNISDHMPVIAKFRLPES